jgi:hypothetical protein
MNAFFFSRISHRQKTCFLAGIIALLTCGVGAYFNSRQFFISYLSAYLFWVGLSLGCLCVAMIHHLTGGRWGEVTRRFLEAGYMTLPMMAILFIPVLFGLHVIYPWAQPDAAGHSDAILHRFYNLNVPGFVLRSALYFAIWIGMALPLRKWSLQQDQTEDPTPTRQARALSGPGVAIYTISVTLAFIDWVMSLESDWRSTMFAVIVCGSQILCSLAFVIMMLAFFRKEPPYSAVVDPGHYQQLGNLLLTFGIFWTCVSFGQLLVTWSGDSPYAILWHTHHIAGGWKWIAGLVALFNFFLPFFLLRSRASEKNSKNLRLLAGLVFLTQIINAWWIVQPVFFQTGLHIHWMDPAALVGLGGLWIAKCAVSFKRAPLLTQNDPRISYSFAHAQ